MDIKLKINDVKNHRCEYDISGEISVQNVKTIMDEFSKTLPDCTDLTINLKKVEGEKSDPFAIIDSVSVYLNSKGDGYADLNTNLANYSTTISEIITDNFAKYTKDEAQNNRDLIKEEILKQLQKRFETQTISDISFKNLRFQ